MNSLLKLKAATAITLTLLFGFMFEIFAVVALIYGPRGSLIGVLLTAVLLAAVGTVIQWFLGPVLIKWTTRMRELEPGEYGWIHDFVAKTAKQANIPKPKLYLVADGTPNAFAFGRTPKDSNIAIHTGLLQVLNKQEVEAVLAHEVGHVKHWDVAVITMASMVPLIVYYTIVLFGSMFVRGRDNRG